MRELSASEFLETEYCILEFIDRICTENHIPYYLAYGTALGAIRHGGFIPWDDDIDIVMFREDYIRFENLFRGADNRIENYKLLSLNLDKDFDYPFPKLTDIRTDLVRDKYRSKVSIGVYIDIFILDKVPEDNELRERMYKKLGRYTTLWEACQKANWSADSKLSKKLAIKLLHLISARWIVRKLDKLSQTYNKTDSSLYRKLTHFINDEPPATKSVFGDGLRVKFVNGMFPVPADYDFYLKGRYGNYMELPPEEKRIPHHDNVAYLK